MTDLRVLQESAEVAVGSQTTEAALRQETIDVAVGGQTTEARASRIALEVAYGAMAPSVPSFLGFDGVTGSPDSNSISFVTDEDVPTGETVILCILHTGTSPNARTITSISDGLGNEYTIDQEEAYTLGSSPGKAFIARAVDVTFIPLGTTITVTFNAADQQMKWVGGIRVSGVNTLDKAVSNKVAAAPWTVGPTEVLSSPNELCLCLATSSAPGSGSVPTDGFTEIIDQSAVGVDRVIIQYKIVTAYDSVSTGGTSANGTLALLSTYMWGEPPAVEEEMIKIGGAFVSKPTYIKQGGVFVSKPGAVKVGGTFV